MTIEANTPSPVAAVLIDPTTGNAYQGAGPGGPQKIAVQGVVAVIRLNPVTGVAYL